MRILIYAHLFPPSKGGIQYSNLEIVKGLSLLGNDVRVIACSNRGIKKFISSCPLSVRILPKWHFTTMHSLSRKGLLNWFLAPLFFFIFFEEIKKFKPDVAFITDETANAFGGAVSNYIKLPYISYWSVPVVGLEPGDNRSKAKSRLNRLVFNQIRRWNWKSYERARNVLVPSASTKEQVVQIIPALQNRVAIVPRSVDDRFFDSPVDPEASERIKKKLGVNKNDFVILSVARLTKKKGIDDVIKALAGMAADALKSIKYVVVGQGQDSEYLKELTVSLHLQEHVVFTGAVEHLELIPIYDICELFLLPSRRGVSESFGRVFVEAAARSKALIGVSEGGMPDIINDGVEGFLIRAGDVPAIRKVIEYTVHDQALVRKMGSSARIKAEKNYTTRAVAMKFEKHLQQVVDANAKQHSKISNQQIAF